MNTLIMKLLSYPTVILYFALTFCHNLEINSHLQYSEILPFDIVQDMLPHTLYRPIVTPMQRVEPFLTLSEHQNNAKE